MPRIGGRADVQQGNPREEVVGPYLGPVFFSIFNIVFDLACKAHQTVSHLVGCEDIVKYIQFISLISGFRLSVTPTNLTEIDGHQLKCQLHVLTSQTKKARSLQRPRLAILLRRPLRRYIITCIDEKTGQEEEFRVYRMTMRACSPVLRHNLVGSFQSKNDLYSRAFLVDCINN